MKTDKELKEAVQMGYALCCASSGLSENAKKAIDTLIEFAQLNDRMFINHIQKHLSIRADVICKICGKSAMEICSIKNEYGQDE